ncbi:hypothetical protein PIB30_074466 [Stylosanthes scabra]|uniref:RNase H type-1 domain-containing protein n=1 Tax=Stylosanthes scabra TaxID=79078 RepID=A0ABU6WQV4_9FABA|nr:hypothetical protein [Stylosanthes scabra]
MHNFDMETARKILMIPKSITGGKDAFIWPAARSGLFSVKSGYDIARKTSGTINTNKCSTSTPPFNNWSEIWSMRVIFRANLSEIDFTDNQQNSARETPQQQNNQTGVTWKPPQIGQVKCNTDGAHLKTGPGATAAVFHDSEGKMITVNTTKVLVSSAIMVEAMAIRDALKIAIQLRINNLIIETDCQVLYQAIKSDYNIAELTPLLHDISSLSQKVLRLGFTWIPREANMLAHHFASLQQHNPANQDWSLSFPTIIERTLFNEEEIARALLRNNSRTLP